MTSWDDPFGPSDNNRGAFPPPPQPGATWPSPGQPYALRPLEQRSRMAAGLLGIFLGGLGVHSFYLGDNRKGVIQIVVTILTCGFGSLWGFIEGIMILAGSINTDAHGVPLQQ